MPLAWWPSWWSTMPRRLSCPRSQSSELPDVARQGLLSLRVRLPVRAPPHDHHRQSRHGAHPLQRLAALREAGHRRHPSERLGLRRAERDQLAALREAGHRRHPSERLGLRRAASHRRLALIERRHHALRHATLPLIAPLHIGQMARTDCLRACAPSLQTRCPHTTMLTVGGPLGKRC